MFWVIFSDKFGNRDYILGIEYATLDHDAEYTVKATNLAGECKQSAQLLVLEEKEGEFIVSFDWLDLIWSLESPFPNGTDTLYRREKFLCLLLNNNEIMDRILFIK